MSTIPETGVIKFSMIKSVFIGTSINNLKFSSFYRNSTYIPITAISTLNIPISSLMKFSNFRNTFNPLPTIISNGVSGNLTMIGNNYVYYTFTSISGTNSITFPLSLSISCSVLVVGGGGGGGGGPYASGGGGGSINYNSSYTFNIGKVYNITVGSGGAGGNAAGTNPSGTGGTNGNLSKITYNSTDLIIANGGGGGYCSQNANNFYAVHGGTPSVTNVNGSISTFYGGTGYFSAPKLLASGGGAGAGGNGGNGNANPSTNTITSYGNGGIGYSSSITTNGGVSTYYAGGGVGGTNPSSGSGTNGLGQNNYGGGGVGYSSTYNNGQSGNNGCVIIAVSYNTFPTIVSNSIYDNLKRVGTNYFYYIFTSTTGTNNITFPVSISCSVLVVGGGGGGGGGFAGSGGAGGNIYYNSSYIFNAGVYNITVGSGGAGGSGYMNYDVLGTGGVSGNLSKITYNSTDLIIANGGGGSDSGYTYAAFYHAANGGSTSATVNGTKSTYSGGIGYYYDMGWVSGGGAGAGGNGVNASVSGGVVTSYGNGGIGYSSTIITNGQTSVYYAGGGAGGSAGPGVPDSGINGLGQNNYGGGGRGFSNDQTNGQSGNPGCVIIAFNYPY